MTIRYQILLASVAILTATSAMAADAPAKKAAAPAVTYVKACEAQGPGFITIPGAETCLKLTGYVRANTSVAPTTKDTAGHPSDRTKSPVSFSQRFQLGVDVRENTQLGVLRSFGVIRSESNSAGTAQTYLQTGYVQLGGLTAGLRDSAFTFFNGANKMIVNADDGQIISALSYAASLGNGLTATASIEDASARTSHAAAADTGSAQIPDIVGVIGYASGPITAQIAVAGHQNYSSTSAGGSQQGYATMAGVKVVPMDGTTFWVQGAYANGALSYLGYNNKGASPSLSGAVSGKVTNDNMLPDYVSGNTDKEAKGWSALASLNQAVGKNFVNLIAVYGEQKTADATPVTWKVTQVEGNFEYRTISGFRLIPAVAYVNYENNAATKTELGIWKGLLRVQRDF